MGCGWRQHDEWVILLEVIQCIGEMLYDFQFLITAEEFKAEDLKTQAGLGYIDGQTNSF